MMYYGKHLKSIVVVHGHALRNFPILYSSRVKCFIQLIGLSGNNHDSILYVHIFISTFPSQKQPYMA